MFIGHFGVGFGAKALTPKISLGSLLLAAQFIDLLWPSLLLLGVEQVRIAPGITAVTPLDFEHYPVSHSLLTVLGWGLLVGGIYWAIRRQARGALVLGLLVISHWALDAIAHRPDLPLYPGSDRYVGLELWASLPLTMLVESALFVLGVWLYARSTRPTDALGKWLLWSLVAMLAIIHVANLFGPPPPDTTSLAWVAQGQWLFVLWGYWIDRHRRPVIEGVHFFTR